mmetsp:Transcript_58429/g.114816  ORF Transcript_58429/g.114816 Transcript_58429/m.114816 type:complete len:174 (-) Transcript_58429:310-831(-)
MARRTSKRSSVEASLPQMMYGYGDIKHPDPRSIKLVNAMVVEHLREVLNAACDKAEWQGKAQCTEHDLLLCVKHDEKRYRKVTHLIEMHELVDKEVRKEGEVLVEKHFDEAKAEAKAAADAERDAKPVVEKEVKPRKPNKKKSADAAAAAQVEGGAKRSFKLTLPGHKSKAKN